MVLKWIEDEFQKGPDKVLVKRLAKVELFGHTSNGKVDLLIHIFFCGSCEYPNGPTLKNGKMIVMTISPFGFFGHGVSVSD